MHAFVRFESAFPDVLGSHVGVFGLVNVLGRHGMLTPGEETARRVGNAWFDAAYPDPATVDPTVYDRDLHPLAAAWFRSSASALLERVPPYLDILDAHAVGWRRKESDDPGSVLYEDAFQIVVSPYS